MNTLFQISSQEKAKKTKIQCSKNILCGFKLNSIISRLAFIKYVSLCVLQI